MVVGVGRQEGGGRGRSKRKEAAEEEQLKTRKRKSSPWKKGRTQGGCRPQQTAQQGTRGGRYDADCTGSLLPMVAAQDSIKDGRRASRGAAEVTST